MSPRPSAASLLARTRRLGWPTVPIPGGNRVVGADVTCVIPSNARGDKIDEVIAALALAGFDQPRPDTVFHPTVNEAHSYPANVHVYPHFSVPDARRLLVASGIQRALSNEYAQRHAADMLAGNWVLNLQPIMVDTKGRLINGKHRMSGLVIAGETDPDITVPFAIAWGVDPATVHIVDQGLVRTVVHSLAFMGEENTGPLAIALKMLLMYERGTLGRDFNKIRLSGPAAREVLQRHPGIREALAERPNRGLWRATSSAVLTHLHRVINAGHPTAELALSQLINGNDIPAGHPAALTREALTRKTKGPVGARNAIVQLAWGIKGYNKIITGKGVDLVVWKPGVESIPRMIALPGRPE